MLGTHAVESQSGQVTTASFVKAKLRPVRMPPAPGENPIRPMTCPLCGKASPCVHARRNTSALMDHLADQNIFADEEQALAPSVTPARAVAGEQRPVADPAWRREIVS